MNRENRRGFSLVELSVVIVVIAVMFGISVTAFKSQLSSTEITTTHDKLLTIQKALDTYFKTNNRYPCPAAGNLAEGAANFGVEGATCDPAACPAGMVCGTRVVRGSLPFVTLGLPNNFGADAWHSKISYAVDNLFTQANGNCESGGALTVLDYSGNSVTTDAVYALISHGKDKAGAYHADSATYTACNTTYKDGENCDANDTFRASNILDSSNVATDYYDDVMMWSKNPNFKTCPAGLRDCRLWLDSSDRCTITLSSGEVSEWRSKGAYKYRALQSSSAIQPTYISSAANLLNARPFVRFVSGDFMYITTTAGDASISSFGDTEYSIVVVFRTTDTAGVIATLADTASYSASSVDRYFNINASKIEHYNYNAAGESLISTSTYNNNLPHVAVTSTGSASPHTLWVDSSQAATGTQIQSSLTGKTALLLGGHSANGYFDGDLLEVLYFDYVLSSDERKLLESYMAVKWGMSY